MAKRSGYNMKYTSKQLWMQRYEQKILEMNSELSGKIDWAGAEYQFSIGKTAEEAATLNNKEVMR